MSGMQIVVTPQGRAALVNAQNTGTLPVTISQVGVTSTAFDPTTNPVALPGELKRIATFAGEVVADDTIHVTMQDDSEDVYSLRGIGLYLQNGTLFACYGQATPIMEKSAQAMVLASMDIRFVQVDATQLTFGDSSFSNPPATTERVGVVELATVEEAAAGDDQVRAVTPFGLRALLNSRFGVGAPSAFVKGLLSLATAALVRAALEIKGAALLDTGHGNGLDADTLDGQHGSWYRSWANLTGVPNLSLAGHTHAAGDVNSGTFDPARIPTLAQSKVSGLTTDLAARVAKSGDTMSGALTINRGLDAANIDREFAVQNGNHYLAVHARMPAGSYNPIVQAGDKCLIWSNGAGGTGAITIAPWADTPYGFRMEANGEATLYGNLTMQRGVPTQQMLSANRAFGYRILANVGDTVDYGLEFGRWTATAWQVKATVHAGGFRVDGQMSVTLASGAQYRATANGVNFFDFGIGATTTNDPDAYLVNRANGGILIYTNNQPRGKFLADGKFEWYSTMRSKGGAAGLEIEGRDNTAHTFTCYYQAGAFRLYSTVAAGDVFGVTTAGALWTTGGYDFGSSRKLKDIAGECPHGLDVVRQVSTLRGKYKPEFNADGRDRLFFDAEQLAELMPETVDREGIEFQDEKVPALKLDQMLPPAYRAIAELASIVEALRDEVQALKAGR